MFPNTSSNGAIIVNRCSLVTKTIWSGLELSVARRDPRRRHARADDTSGVQPAGRGLAPGPELATPPYPGGPEIHRLTVLPGDAGQQADRRGPGPKLSPETVAFLRPSLPQAPTIRRGGIVSAALTESAIGLLQDALGDKVFDRDKHVGGRLDFSMPVCSRCFPGLYLALTINCACAIKLISFRRNRTRRYVSADISAVGIDNARPSAWCKV